MKKLVLALALLPLLGVAQTATTARPATEATGKTKTAEETSADGMKFEHGSWADILAKAKKENKYIIMDCFTTWCGPCKFMDANIFPTKEAGDYFNANFLNVKVQFDSTANDNEEVKAWKKDMKQIEKEYAINAYPTYLIFDPNGQAVHRAVGSTAKAADFIARGKEGKEAETQYYTQLRKYESGERSPAFLKKIALMAQTSYDTKSATKISTEYIAGITDFYTKENADFLVTFTKTSKDKGFEVMLNNPEKMDAVIGAGKSKARVLAIIAGEEMYPAMRKIMADKTNPNPDVAPVVATVSQKYPQFAKDFGEMGDKYVYNVVYSEYVYTPLAKAVNAKTKVDWDAAATALRAKDPKNVDEMIGKGKLVYYQATKDWSSFQTDVVAYMNKFGAKATPAEMNTYAWTVFENCKDMTCVTQALDWSKQSFAENKNPMFMDTYANILHKLGKTKEAIEMQEKAIALTTDEASKKSLQDTLEKMKKGEKTWTEE